MHVTETCDTSAAADDSNGDGDGEAVAPPHLITNVETTDATVPDSQMTEPIHARLAGRGLLPTEHYLDSGYPSAQLLVSSLASFDIALRTPMLADTAPQTRAGAGFDHTAFSLDFDAQQPTYPHSHTNNSWNPIAQHGTDTIVITLAKRTYGPCPVQAQRTTSTSGRRQLTVHPRNVHHTPLATQAAPTTKDLETKYALRTDVEATIRQGMAVTSMRHTHYRELTKTRLEHTNTATAVNLIRLHTW